MPSTKRKRSSSRGAVAPYRRSSRFRRGRVGRRRYGRSKMGRMMPNYSFHRWVTSLGGVDVTSCTYDTGTSIIASTAAVANPRFSFSFKLSDVPGLSEFTTLFDSYMITGVMLQIKMINNPDAYSVLNLNSGAQTGSNFYPTIWYVPDHDDASNVTLAQIKEFEKVRHKVLRPNSELNIMLRPTTLTQLYRTSTTTGYAENRRRQWIDIAQNDVPHYGVKCVLDFEGLDPVQEYKFKVNAKYYFRCKNVR